MFAALAALHFGIATTACASSLDEQIDAALAFAEVQVGAAG